MITQGVSTGLVHIGVPLTERNRSTHHTVGLYSSYSELLLQTFTLNIKSFPS